MKLARYALWFGVLVLMTITTGAQQPPASVSATSGDLPQRKELRRSDLSGAPNMEVIVSIAELKPGDEMPLHIHHGIETGYIMGGGMTQAPGKPPSELVAGTPIMNQRDVPHGGYTVVGSKTIKLFTVHIVDKGKPLYDVVKK